MQNTNELRRRVQYFISYYRRMNWHMTPQDLIEMCAEEIECHDQATWNFLMDARNYLNQEVRERLGMGA